MVKSIICLILCLGFLVVSKPAFAQDCSEDPRACFDGFRDDDSIITESGKAEKTFSFPPVKAGFILDVHHVDILPHIGVEVVNFEVPHAGDFALDAGVAPGRVFTSLTWEFIPIVKAGPSIWVGYNVRENSPSFGIGFTVLDF